MHITLKGEGVLAGTAYSKKFWPSPPCVCLHFSWPLFPSSTFMMVSNLPATNLTERKDISKFMNMICACATRDRLFYSHRRFLYAHTKSYGSLFILKFLPSLNNYCRLIFYCNIAWGETHCNYSDLGYDRLLDASHYSVLQIFLNSCW